MERVIGFEPTTLCLANSTPLNPSPTTTSH